MAKKRAAPREEEGMGEGTASARGDSGLAAAVRGHALFFDDLVELVPAKFYVPADRSEDWMRYKHSKSEKAAAKEARKLNSKKAKRLKLDPEEAVSTTEALQRRAEASSDESEEEEEEEEEEEASRGPRGKANGKGAKGGHKRGDGKGDGGGAAAPLLNAARWTLPAEGGAVPHAELQARLRAKIEAARGLRKAEERNEAAAAAKAWRGKATSKTPSPHGKRAPPSSSSHGGKQKAAPHAEAKGKEGAAVGADGVMMSRVDSGGHGSKGNNAKKLSKKAQLHKAEAVQEVLAEGGVKAERHQWAAAMKRAAGEKVLDDPKLLKRSLKREAKRKEKSAATWAQKEKEHKDARDAKQNKRQTNLKARKDLVKAQRHEKRDKKLLRPGFEGRSTGFINKAKE